MSESQEHDKLVGLTMDEAQVILLALYVADTQKVKTSVHSTFPTPIISGQKTAQLTPIKAV